MTLVPVVAHHEASPSARQQACVDRVAEELRDAHRWLTLEESYQPLVPDHLEDLPTLHLDDLSDIALAGEFYDVTCLQDRARFRAGDGDVVATCSAPNDVFVHYCEQQLGLGGAEWLHPEPKISRLGVASACWTNRAARQTLVSAMRNAGLAYVHPHMGSFRVWATALLLHKASRRPLRVIGPPPGVTKAVNDKVWFASTVRRLLGEEFLPPTAEAWNFSTLARLVQRMARESQQIVVKLPDSAGGAGNFLLPAGRYRGEKLGPIRAALRDRLSGIPWYGEQRLLVASWETDVLSAPSAQLWIPPETQAPPVIEGLYEQMLEGEEGLFVGSHPASFPAALSQHVADHCWLLARLFQRLGYVGRCSFDMLLVGDDLEACQLKFVECNGRWGSTSAPMTLMNRLVGDWATRPYATRECTVPGLERVQFADLLDHFERDLFDVRTGAGTLVFYTPSALAARPGIDVLALAESWQRASDVVRVEVPERLQDLVADRR